MKKLLIVCCLILLNIASIAQEDMKGTIKVQKNGKIFSLLFDNVNNRLVGKDNYGNILDSAIISFDVMVIIKGIEFKESVTGHTLSTTMQNRINRVDNGTTLFFKNIRVKEKNGTVTQWPKFNTKIGFAFEREE